MKIEFDKKLFKYAVYISVTTISIYIVFLLLFNIKSIFKYAALLLLAVINLIKPLLIGMIIAYILYPVTKMIENLLKNNKLFKINSFGKRRVSAVILSYVSVLAIITALIWGIYLMSG